MNRIEFKEKLKKIKCVLLDLDGTVYIGNGLIDGADEAIERFRQKGVQIVYLTNNSSKTSAEYVEKLSHMGVCKEGDFVLTSAEATARYLLDNGLNEDVYFLATDKIKNSFLSAGIKLCESNAKTAVLAYDTELDYKKACAFNREIICGAKYIATHADKVCPSEGVYLPDAGSFIALFNASSQKMPEVVIGKPNTFMGDIIKKKYGFNSYEIMMVGDRLYTDVRFGKNCGFLTALVLSGETDERAYEVSEDKADGVFDDLLSLSRLLYSR